MQTEKTELTQPYLLRVAATLWLAYLLALLSIDLFFYPRPIFPPRYYLLNGLTALAVLGLALWPGAQSRLGRALLPLIIAALTLTPIITSNLVIVGLPPTPANRPEALMLRTLPVLCVALALTAWQYRWPVVIGFSVGSNLLTLGLHLALARPGAESFLPPLTISLIQTVSFLVLGYFINRLIRQLQQQQAALKQAHTRLVDYAGTLEELTLSRERNRLARELHDTLAHTLSALSVQLETAKAYWDVDPRAVQTILDTSLAATRSGLQETRRALKALRAAPLDDLGLLLALRQLAEESAARANLALTLALPTQLPALSPPVEQALYRITQEALANTAQHAQARALKLALIAEAGMLTLLVQDDGVGFDTQRAVAGHFGLAGMQERAALLGGELIVKSQSGTGTTVRFSLGYSSEQE